MILSRLSCTCWDKQYSIFTITSHSFYTEKRFSKNIGIVCIEPISLDLFSSRLPDLFQYNSFHVCYSFEREKWFNHFLPIVLSLPSWLAHLSVLSNSKVLKVWKTTSKWTFFLYFKWMRAETCVLNWCWIILGTELIIYY